MAALQISFDYSTGFAPAFDYDYISQYARRDTNDLNVAIHYHDCKCFYCTDKHFPCDDLTCDYCNSVRTIRDQEYCKQIKYMISYDDPMVIITPQYTLPHVDQSEDNIIGYNTYMAWGDREYAYTDMLWRKCSMCDMLIDGLTSDDYDTCCGEVCQKKYNEVQENETIYCAHCGENEVESDGDYCDDCQDQESHSNLPYMLGEVLEVSDYSNTTEAWINPNGDLHYVPCYNDYGIGHYETAQELGFSGTCACENAGYIHVSTYYNRNDPFHYVPNHPTDAQIETCMLMCDAHGWDYPEFVIDWMDHTADNELEETTIAPMQNLSYSWLTMKRVDRDRFYPLSGD